MTSKPTIYRGKHPSRIESVWRTKGRETMCRTNAGEVYRLDWRAPIHTCPGFPPLRSDVHALPHPWGSRFLYQSAHRMGARS